MQGNTAMSHIVRSERTSRLPACTNYFWSLLLRSWIANVRLAVTIRRSRSEPWQCNSILPRHVDGASQHPICGTWWVVRLPYELWIDLRYSTRYKSVVYWTEYATRCLAITGRIARCHCKFWIFDSYRILQRHRAVSPSQHGFLVGLCLQNEWIICKKW